MLRLLIYKLYYHKWICTMLRQHIKVYRLLESPNFVKDPKLDGPYCMRCNKDL